LKKQKKENLERSIRANRESSKKTKGRQPKPSASQITEGEEMLQKWGTELPQQETGRENGSSGGDNYMNLSAKALRDQYGKGTKFTYE